MTYWLDVELAAHLTAAQQTVQMSTWGVLGYWDSAQTRGGQGRKGCGRALAPTVHSGAR